MLQKVLPWPVSVDSRLNYFHLASPPESTDEYGYWSYYNNK